MQKFQRKVCLTQNLFKKIIIIILYIARSLLKKMLEKDPKKRITASQTLSHKFFNSETLENNDDSQGTPLIMDPNYQSDLTTMKE